MNISHKRRIQKFILVILITLKKRLKNHGQHLMKSKHQRKKLKNSLHLCHLILIHCTFKSLMRLFWRNSWHANQRREPSIQRLHRIMVPSSHKASLSYSTIIGTISIREANLSCSSAAYSVFFKLEYEYMCNFVTQMAPLEVFQHLKISVSFQVEQDIVHK